MPNRYVCSALQELRKALELHNKIYAIEEKRASFVSLLVEEIQTYVNRMEAGLGDKWDMHAYQDELQSLKKEVRALRAEKDSLEADQDLPPKKKRRGTNINDLLRD